MNAVERTIAGITIVAETLALVALLALCLLLISRALRAMSRAWHVAADRRARRRARGRGRSYPTNVRVVRR